MKWAQKRCRFNTKSCGGFFHVCWTGFCLITKRSSILVHVCTHSKIIHTTLGHPQVSQMLSQCWWFRSHFSAEFYLKQWVRSSSYETGTAGFKFFKTSRKDFGEFLLSDPTRQMTNPDIKRYHVPIS